MAELTFKSPGVSTREIDLSGPTQILPQGTPAGVIGTALKGRAFVPITVATFRDFVAEFGSTDGEKFGPLAMNEWLRNARAGTYVRVLGAGNGKRRNTDGSVTNAGFVVGAQQVQSNGSIGNNIHAALTGSEDLTPGRTYFLGAFHEQASGVTDFTDAGYHTDVAHPFIRGVLMAPEGVLLALSSSAASNNTPSAGKMVYGQSSLDGPGADGDAGLGVGTVDLNNAKQEFVMLLNGFSNVSENPNVITASFDPTAANYFGKVLNTDPQRIEDTGHLLYTRYDIHSDYAVLTGSGIISEIGAGGGVADDANKQDIAFLLTGSTARNVGSSTVPNYEGFVDRFRTPFSPFVISQRLGNDNKNLFKIHALDDGAYATSLFKITIENIQASNNANNKFGKFDLLVRRFNDNDNNQEALESYRGINLDPSSDRYIAKVVGDQNIFFDFDQKVGSQKLVVEGTHPNRSSYIRVEVHDDITNGNIDQAAIPCGFRGHHHLVTSGSSILLGGTHAAGPSAEELTRASQPPVPFRRNVAVGKGDKKKINSSLCWGVQFEVNDNKAEPNKNELVDPTIASLTKYFPLYDDSNLRVLVGANEGAADANGTVLDADRFNNNLFTLERIQVSTGSDDRPVATRWGAATYRRNGKKAASLTDVDGSTTYSEAVTRFLDASKDFAHLPSRKYLKFNFFLQGGFDGVNIFDRDKTELNNAAVKREQDDSTNQGGVLSGPTINAYRKAVDVLKERSDANIQLLAIPGIRHNSVTDFAIDAVEDRFDALYLMDIEERDSLNTVVTGSGVNVHVTNTVNAFEGRNLDSSFAAAYFPDVVVTDPTTQTNVQCPPSVAVLGAFSLNDAVAHPWFAPAGFTRGALGSVIEAQVKLNRANLDALYEADVNPLTSFAHTPGVVVFGQKTLQAAQSALDRVNVRRLLIEIRRRVRRIGESLLFEPNREDTLSRFSAAVNPVLQRIQQQQGVDRFRVQIDTTTTTQADVENNTIRGKIFLQPTRSVEFVALDFVVTNQGAEV